MRDLLRFGFALDRQREWHWPRIDASALGVLLPAAFHPDEEGASNRSPAHGRRIS
jgi:hypothetical protein